MVDEARDHAQRRACELADLDEQAQSVCLEELDACGQELRLVDTIHKGCFVAHDAAHAMDSERHAMDELVSRLSDCLAELKAHSELGEAKAIEPPAEPPPPSRPPKPLHKLVLNFTVLSAR